MGLGLVAHQRCVVAACGCSFPQRRILNFGSFGPQLLLFPRRIFMRFNMVAACLPYPTRMTIFPFFFPSSWALCWRRLFCVEVPTAASRSEASFSSPLPVTLFRRYSFLSQQHKFLLLHVWLPDAFKARSTLAARWLLADSVDFMIVSIACVFELVSLQILAASYTSILFCCNCFLQTCLAWPIACSLHTQ